MPKALFTAEQVYQTADSLVAEGKEVSALNLLAKLGGGSLTTIYKHLFAWQEARKQERSITAQDIPEPVQTAFLAAMNSIWRAAAMEAARDVSDAREKAKAEIDVFQVRFEEALRAIEKLESEGDEKDSEIDILLAKVAQLDTSIRQSESDLAAQKATADQLREQVKSQELELARMHKEAEIHRQDLQSEMEKLRAEKEAAIKEVADALGQLKSAKEQHSELVAKVGKHLGVK